MSKNLEQFLNATNLQLIAISSGYNFHGSSRLSTVAVNPRSNLNKRLLKFGDGSYTLYVHKIGRSGHDKYEIAIFKEFIDQAKVESSASSYYASSRHDEVIVKNGSVLPKNSDRYKWGADHTSPPPAKML